MSRVSHHVETRNRRTFNDVQDHCAGDLVLLFQQLGTGLYNDRSAHAMSDELFIREE